MTEKRLPSTFTLLVLMALASVGAVLFTPALPMIKQQFQVSTTAVQWTVSIFVFGYAFGQLIYGPFANRFGRKPTLYVAIIIAFVGSVMCGFSSHLDSFSTLMVGRLIMALGSSAGLALSFTIINDVYSTQESRGIIAYVSLAFAILPGLAIFIGGFIVKHFLWEACFYFLAAYYVFAFILCFFLPETVGEKDEGALRLKAILCRYWKTARDSNLWVYTSMWGACTAIVYIFSATAPIIAISYMHLSPEIFGTLNLTTSIGLLIGGLLAAQINKRIHHRTVILLGTVLMMIGVGLLFVFSKSGHESPFAFFSAMFVVYFSMSFIFSNAAALAPQHVSDKASASSMMSFINMMFAVVGLYLMGLLHANPERIMSEAFLLILFFQIVLLVISRLPSFSRE
ncbi:MAG: multidrug effflux MFS transporter [Coxiellaceae bacterium]|nr:multidrug effflux MFS transporter [Coxiellaceae bacterium]